MHAARTAALACAGLLAAACGSHHEEADVRDERAVPPDLRRLEVRLPLGSITVHAGEGGSMLLVGRSRKTAPTAAGLERLRDVDFTPRFGPGDRPGTYRLEMPGLPPDVDPRTGAALILRAELYLPRDVAVDVETDRGFLSVVGRDAAVRLHTGSGDVQIDDVDGAIEVFTGLGDGILHAVRGSVNVESGGGAILAYVEGLGPDGVRLKTREPSITLHLPAGAGFELDARVLRSNGDKVGVRNSFGVPVIADGAGHAARGTVGAGGPPVVVETGAGWISIPTLDRDRPR